MRSRLVPTLAALALALAGCSARPLPAPALSAHARDVHDPPAPPEARDAVAFAQAHVGRAYCWGGTGPACFDCSGLVQRAWASVGVRLPRTSAAMGDHLGEVPLSEVRPGDVLWWPGHVALYAGDGWQIEALDRERGVVRRPLTRPLRALRPQG